MQIESVNDLVAYIALILSVVGLVINYLVYRVKAEARYPALALNVEDLPPYNKSMNETILYMENKGGGVAYISSLEIEYHPISCPTMIVETRNKRINPNSRVSENFRLLPLIPGTKEVSFTLHFKAGLIRKKEDYSRLRIALA